MRIRTLLQIIISIAMVIVLGVSAVSWLIEKKLNEISGVEEQAQAAS